METKNYKTNIKCTGCLSKVTPVLNELAGEDNWEVDVQTPEKRLTLINPDVNENELIASLKELGYTAEPLG